MRIIQCVPAFHHGDAIGNNIIALHQCFLRNGYESLIVAIESDPERTQLVHPISDLMGLADRSSVLILHYALPSVLNDIFARAPGRKILIYHNITPEIFLQGYPAYQRLAVLGRQHVIPLARVTDLAVADSEFNREELIRMGYQHSRVVPILMDFDFKGIDTNPVLQEMYKDDFVNLIFVGRLSPNKCQHDIIRLYGYFKKFVRERSRLFLIGKYDGFESYYTQLIRYAARLKLGDLYLTGRVSLQELVTYYRIADVFVSMSEHEGFGVPLIESMFFGIPVVAFRAAAVPGTMGDSGILFSDKTRMIEIAELIGHLVESADFRENIVFRQKQRFDRCFSPASVERQWMHILTEF